RKANAPDRGLGGEGNDGDGIPPRARGIEGLPVRAHGEPRHDALAAGRADGEIPWVRKEPLLKAVGVNEIVLAAARVEAPSRRIEGEAVERVGNLHAGDDRLALEVDDDHLV